MFGQKNVIDPVAHAIISSECVVVVDAEGVLIFIFTENNRASNLYLG